MGSGEWGMGKDTVSKSQSPEGKAFSICHLRYDICHCPEVSNDPLAMINIKSQMANGK
jgi:hypothetical protein